MQQDPRQRWNTASGRAWEPRTAARTYAELVAEQKTIATRFNEVPVGVLMSGDRVTGVVTREHDLQGKLGAQHTHEARVIIDATYEADLASDASHARGMSRTREKFTPTFSAMCLTFFPTPSFPEALAKGTTARRPSRIASSGKTTAVLIIPAVWIVRRLITTLRNTHGVARRSPSSRTASSTFSASAGVAT
jgi:hypothetical protein